MCEIFTKPNDSYIPGALSFICELCLFLREVIFALCINFEVLTQMNFKIDMCPHGGHGLNGLCGYYGFCITINSLIFVESIPRVIRSDFCGYIYLMNKVCRSNVLF